MFDEISRDHLAEGLKQGQAGWHWRVIIAQRTRLAHRVRLDQPRGGGGLVSKGKTSCGRAGLFGHVIPLRQLAEVSLCSICEAATPSRRKRPS